MTLKVSIKLTREALKMEPSVGFFATAPGRLTPEDETAASVALPGSGIIDDRRELPDPDSDGTGEAGLGLSRGFVDASAVSRTSFRNGFLVDANNAKCSSGTVSRFFSMNPSTS